MSRTSSDSSVNHLFSNIRFLMDDCRVQLRLLRNHLLGELQGRCSREHLQPYSRLIWRTATEKLDRGDSVW
jgi:hypothetical protein